MKQKILILLFLTGSLHMFAQTARVQVIHNSADPAAARVDVYLNGSLLLDDFQFRKATPFIDAPAETPITISIAPFTSTSVDDAIANFEYVLSTDEKYVIVANGVLDPLSFGSNPDATSTAFNLFVKAGAKEIADSPSTIDVTFFHGTTDAPEIDVLARNIATLIDNASYTQFTGYLSLSPGKYLLDITPGDDNSIIVATARAFLNAGAGFSATIFASGFLSTDDEPTGSKSFKVMYALADGTVKSFPILTNAPVQVIHNAADPNAQEVDVYLNGALAIDNFAFRTATPYLALPANQIITIGIAPGTSTSALDILANFDFNLRAGEGYTVIANGVLNPIDFASNPEGNDIGFNLWARANAYGSAILNTDITFIGVHGSTDAPEVDIIARDVATLLDNVQYGAISDYITVPASSYILDVTLSEDTEAIVVSYDADLTSLGGGSAVVFASGFLDPTANPEGSQSFGLWYALADGSTGAFPVSDEIVSEDEEISRIALISNSIYPNPTSDVLNISLEKAINGTIKLKNLSGEIVFSTSLKTEGSTTYQLIMDQLSSGIYLLEIFDGIQTEVSKVSIL